MWHIKLADIATTDPNAKCSCLPPSLSWIQVETDLRLLAAQPLTRILRDKISVQLVHLLCLCSLVPPCFLDSPLTINQDTNFGNTFTVADVVTRLTAERPRNSGSVPDCGQIFTSPPNTSEGFAGPPSLIKVKETFSPKVRRPEHYAPSNV